MLGAALFTGRSRIPIGSSWTNFSGWSRVNPPAEATVAACDFRARPESVRVGSASAGQGLDLPDGGAATPDGLAGYQSRDAAEKGGQPNLGFHASQRSSKAIMGARRERDVACGRAGDVECVRIGENAGIVVGGRVEHQSLASGFEPFALYLHVNAGPGAGERGRGHKSQHLLYRCRPTAWVSLERSPLGGMLTQQIGTGGDQRAGGLVPGDDKEDAVSDNVSAVLVVCEFPGAEHREQVIAIAPGALIKQGREKVQQRTDRRIALLHERAVPLVGERASQRRGLLPQPAPLLIRHAHHIADDKERQRLSERVHKIERNLVTNHVEQLIDPGAHHYPEALNPAGGKQTAETGAQAAVPISVNAEHPP